MACCLLAACQTAPVATAKKPVDEVASSAVSAPPSVVAMAGATAPLPLAPLALPRYTSPPQVLPAATGAASAGLPQPSPFGTPQPGQATLTVRTVAGGAAGAVGPNYSGIPLVTPVDGPGTQATFLKPLGLALGPDGDLYVADNGDGTIRRIVAPATAPVVSTWAGKPDAIGTAADALASDAATPAAAHLVTPVGLLFAPDGTLYFSESQGNRIRQIAPGGQVTITSGYPDGRPGDSNYVGRNSTDGTYASFLAPVGLALATKTSIDILGALCVADAGNQRIREVNVLKTTADTDTLAGNKAAGCADGVAGTALFDTPTGLAVDGQNNLYVQDSGNHRIRLVTPDSTVTTYAGPATGQSGDPRGLVDGPLATVRFDFTGSVGPGLAFGPDGALYVADTGNNRIRRIKDGMVTTVAGSGDPRDSQAYADGPGTTARFNRPQGIAVAADGTIYVSDTGNDRIRAIK